MFVLVFGIAAFVEVVCAGKSQSSVSWRAVVELPSDVRARPCVRLQRNFVDAYNFARRLKTLRGLTPYEFICKAWTSEPHRFKISPLQQMPGLNT